MIDIDKVKLRKDIYNKYRTLKNFSRKTKIPYNKIMLVFNSLKDDREALLDIHYAYENTVIDKVEGYIIDEDREAIRICILTKFKSYTAFCSQHDSYDTVYLSNVIGGRLVEETVKYKRLVNLLKRDYGLVLSNAEK